MIMLTFHQFTELNNYNFALIIIGLAKLQFAFNSFAWVNMEYFMRAKGLRENCWNYCKYDDVE